MESELDYIFFKFHNTKIKLQKENIEIILFAR